MDIKQHLLQTIFSRPFSVLVHIYTHTRWSKRTNSTLACFSMEPAEAVLEGMRLFSRRWIKKRHFCCCWLPFKFCTHVRTRWLAPVCNDFHGCLDTRLGELLCRKRLLGDLSFFFLVLSLTLLLATMKILKRPIFQSRFSCMEKCSCWWYLVFGKNSKSFV